MLVFIALLMTVLLVTVVFSVDLAFMQLTRTQLRAATDAASRAGTEALSRTQDTEDAREAAKRVAAQNLVNSQPLLLSDDDIEFGRSNRTADGSVEFLEGDEPFNTVQVTGRRTSGSLSGPVPLFLGRILGVGHFEPVYTAASMNLDRDLCLVVDRSGSMKTGLEDGQIPAGLGSCDPPHPTLSRWGALTVAVQSFISGLEETNQIEQLALVSYASAGSYCGIPFTNADLNQPLSFDYTNTTAEMARLSSIPINGFTNIAAGIDRGVVALTDPARARPLAERTMVLLTDGIFNRGRHPRLAAEDAARQDIVIHTITFSADAEIGAMQEVATATGGKHFHAPDAASLQRIFREIAVTLPVVMTK
jgi:hypothetical protein